MSKPKSSKPYYIIPLLFSLFPFYSTITSAPTPVSASTPASTLEYSSNTNIQFTFNPTLSVSVSGDLMIDNLSPGTAKDSNIIDVNVATNNVTGYTLSATVGNTNNPSNELRHSSYSNNSNNNYKFTNTSTDITELSNLEPDTWGYNYSTDKGVTWHDYSTLPLYNTTGTTLSEKYIASNDIIKFKIGAKASTTQPAGTYTNTINFTATAFPDAEIKYYMHEFTNELCQALATDDNYTVYDIRDNNDYTVRYINGACWMTQNLRITHTSGYPEGVISNSNSDFHAISISLPENGYHAPTQNDLDAVSSLGYSAKELGVWYNFTAASALTNGAEESICPQNWHLPFYSTSEHGQGNLYDLTTSYSPENAQDFSPIYGGYYMFGDSRLRGPTSNAAWWSSTVDAERGANYRYFIHYEYEKLNPYTVGFTGVWLGFYVRCVRSS